MVRIGIAGIGFMGMKHYEQDVKSICAEKIAERALTGKHYSQELREQE
jgi:hypothetical protein